MTLTSAQANIVDNVRRRCKGAISIVSDQDILNFLELTGSWSDDESVEEFVADILAWVGED
jgi:hypothetical protein